MKVYRIQVLRGEEWCNIGPPYATRAIAVGRRSFVKRAWHGLPTRVKSFPHRPKAVTNSTSHAKGSTNG